MKRPKYHLCLTRANTKDPEQTMKNVREREKGKDKHRDRKTNKAIAVSIISYTDQITYRIIQKRKQPKHFINIFEQFCYIFHLISFPFQICPIKIVVGCIEHSHSSIDISVVLNKRTKRVKTIGRQTHRETNM